MGNGPVWSGGDLRALGIVISSGWQIIAYLVSESGLQRLGNTYMVLTSSRLRFGSFDAAESRLTFVGGAGLRQVMAL